MKFSKCLELLDKIAEYKDGYKQKLQQCRTHWTSITYQEIKLNAPQLNIWCHRVMEYDEGSYVVFSIGYFYDGKPIAIIESRQINTFEEAKEIIDSYFEKIKNFNINEYWRNL